MTSKHPEVSAKFVIFDFPRYLIASAVLSSLNDPQTVLDAGRVECTGARAESCRRFSRAPGMRRVEPTIGAQSLERKHGICTEDSTAN